MALLIDRYVKKKDEEEEEKLKTPSQRAATEQKAEKLLIDKYTKPKEPKEKEPELTKPTLREKIEPVIQKVKEFFKKPEKKTPVLETITGAITGGAFKEEEKLIYKKLENAYLSFPTIFPNPERAGFRISTVKGELVRRGATEAVNTFWSKPIDNTLQATRDYLDYHSEALETLAEAQKFIEDFEYTDPITKKKIPVGLNKNPLHRGIAQGVATTFLGSSNDVKAVFEKRLNHSVTIKDQVYETVGSIIGQVMSYYAGGATIKALGFGKATLPILFATLGQTSAPPKTTIKQRIAKLPVDVATGWLFTKLPVFKRGGITSENIKTLFKGTLGATGIGGGLGFTHALIEGKSREEQIQMAATQAAVLGLFHLAGSSLGLLDNEIRGLKEIKGKARFTPDEVRTNVRNVNAEDTNIGKDLLKLADEAEKLGKDIELNMTKFQQGVIGKRLGVPPAEEEKFVGVGELVDRGAPPRAREKPTEKAIEPVEKLPVEKPKAPVVIPTEKPPVEAITEGREVKISEEYGSATEYIEAKGLDPASVEIIDDKNFVVEDSAGERAILTELPISAFGKPKFETATEYKAGKKITDPIEVEIREGKYFITDGANRFTQAVANKDKTIPVILIESREAEIPKALEPLAQEARKYRSAEEFIEAIGETSKADLEDIVQFHGTQKGEVVRKAISEGTLFGTKDGLMGEGFYVTSSTKLGAYFGKQVSTTGTGVSRVMVKTEPTVIAIDMSGLKTKKHDFGKQEYYDFLEKKGLSANNYNKELANQGYDALNLLGRGETIIFDTKKVKELNLTNLYTQATKGVEKPTIGKEIKEGQDIKDLDAQIRTIKEPTKNSPEWEVEIGLQESLGEQGGDILTQTYDIKPTLAEIRSDIVEEYKRTKTEINKEVATGVVAKSGRDELIEGAIDKVLVKIPFTPLPSPTKLEPTKYRLIKYGRWLHEVGKHNFLHLTQ